MQEQQVQRNFSPLHTFAIAVAVGLGVGSSFIGVAMQWGWAALMWWIGFLCFTVVEGLVIRDWRNHV